MVPLLWLGWSVAVLVVMFLTLVAVMGAASLRAPDWNQRLREVVEDEVASRGLTTLDSWTEAQHRAVSRMLGAAPVRPEHSEADARLIAILVVLTETKSSHELESDVTRRREILQAAALERQRAAVATTPSLTVASWIWAAIRVWSNVVVAWAGFAWFLPRSLPHWRRRAESAMTSASVIGTLGGLLWWFLVGSASDRDGMGWTTLVGVVLAVSSVVALAVVVMGLLGAVVRSTFGRPREWTARGVATGVAYVSTTVALVTLFATDVPRQVGGAMLNTVERMQVDDGWMRAAGAVLFLSVVVCGCINAARRACARRLVMSERVAASVVFLLLVVVGLYVLIWSVDPGANNGSALVWGIGGIISLGMAAAAVFSCVEWSKKYRNLIRAGWPIARRGFRWWMLWAWVGILILIVAVENMRSDFSARLGSSLVRGELSLVTEALAIVSAALSVIAALASIAAFFSFVPLAVVSWVFVCSVSREHERWLIAKTGPEPVVSGESSARD